MLRRLIRIIRGLLGGVLTDVENSNPRALVEVERDNLSKQIVRFNSSLAEHAGFMDRLIQQVKKLENQEQDLVNRTSSAIRQNLRDRAGQLALELQKVREQLAENKTQLDAAEQTFRSMKETRDKTIQETKEKIQRLKRLISDTELREAQADMHELATGQHTASGTPAESLSRLEEQLEERKSRAVGRIKLAQSDLEISPAQDMKQEQIKAEEALREFELEFQLETTPRSAVSEDEPDEKPLKDMGPREKE